MDGGYFLKATEEAELSEKLLLHRQRMLDYDAEIMCLNEGLQGFKAGTVPGKESDLLFMSESDCFIRYTKTHIKKNMHERLTVLIQELKKEINLRENAASLLKQLYPGLDKQQDVNYLLFSEPSLQCQSLLTPCEESPVLRLGQK